MWEPLSLDEILGGNWELEDKDKDNSLPQDDYLSFAHNDSVWMQYTGLKDKNGKEIYEGDVVELFNIIDETEGNWEVFWSQERWGLRRGDDEYDNGDYYRGDDIRWEVWQDGRGGVKVIGNIYENPELLTP